MQKPTIVALGLAVLLAGASQPVFAPDAGARDKSATRKAKSVKPVKHSRHRTAKQAADCTYFDNGKPDSALDFKNPCDSEEFWRRQADRAGDVND